MNRFSASAPRWMKQLLAAAACLALGALLHAWLNPPPTPPPVAARDQTPGPTESPAIPAQPSSVAQPTVATMKPPVPRLPQPLPSVAPPAMSAEVEAARLRERVQILASQVAALNQVLTQHVTLPSGVTRLHVFRLTSAQVPEANAPEAQRDVVESELLPDAPAARRFVLPIPLPTSPPITPPTQPPPPTESLPDALAALAARQHTPLPTPQPPPTDPQTREVVPETPGNLAIAVDPAPTVAASAALNNGQPLGFYDPETGHGAIALFNENPTPDLAYAVWSRTTGADGTLLVQNVGVKSAINPATVISFSNSGHSSTQPTFFITLEPFDGLTISSVPTGPVVAAPPTSVP